MLTPCRATAFSAYIFLSRRVSSSKAFIWLIIDASITRQAIA
jgi:hypothetical protein